MNLSNTSVLIVDDEEDIVELLSFTLKKEGMTIYTASNGIEAIEIAFKSTPNLILLDRMMPKMDGIETCKFLRQNQKLSNTKIIFLSALNDDSSQIEGLDIGADDYLSKPIKSELLISKIKAVLRKNQSQDSNQEIIELGEIKIDLSQFVVWKLGESIKFPKKEFELLLLLMKQPNNVVRREEILKKIWGEEVIIGDRTIDVHIRKIREKIGDQCIETVKGVGYKFVSK